MLTLAASSRLMITEAERRFPVRVKVAIPPTGFGERLNRTPAGMRGVINDAIAVYFRDSALAAAFSARSCAPVASTTAEGFLNIRTDEPTQCIPMRARKTP